MADKYTIARLDDIPSPVPPEPNSYAWKPIRHHLGIKAFGVNANVAPRAGDCVVEEHTEVGGEAADHEELYYVARGRALFIIDGQEVDAPAGSLVFVPDPGTLRSATAAEPETTVLCVGAKQGEAFDISPWERKYFKD